MADARFIEILLPWSWLDWDRSAQHWSCPPAAIATLLKHTGNADKPGNELPRSMQSISEKRTGLLGPSALLGLTASTDFADNSYWFARSACL